MSKRDILETTPIFEAIGFQRTNSASILDIQNTPILTAFKRRELTMNRPGSSVSVVPFISLSCGLGLGHLLRVSGAFGFLRAGCLFGSEDFCAKEGSVLFRCLNCKISHKWSLRLRPTHFAPFPSPTPPVLVQAYALLLQPILMPPCRFAIPADGF